MFWQSELKKTSSILPHVQAGCVAFQSLRRCQLLNLGWCLPQWDATLRLFSPLAQNYNLKKVDVLQGVWCRRVERGCESVLMFTAACEITALWPAGVRGKKPSPPPGLLRYELYCRIIQMRGETMPPTQAVFILAGTASESSIIPGELHQNSWQWKIVPLRHYSRTNSFFCCG